MIVRALQAAAAAIAPAMLLAAVSVQLSSTATGQEPPALLATSQYLFVVRGDWIYQYDVDTLLLKGRAAIPDASRPDADPRAARSARNSQSRRATGKAAKTDKAPRTTADTFEGAAGGRFGGRTSGRQKSSGARNKAGATAASKPPFQHKVARAPATAISDGLSWLAKHQDADGRWDADGFMKHDKKGEASTGAGSAVHDVGVTGLAMLAMLGDGSTLRSGPHQKSLKRAANWLRQQQDDNGRFGTNASHDFIYDHAIATYAMCEAYGLSEFKPLRQSAQRGINYLESHRNPYSVWRYQPRDNDNDISVTSWCLIACKSGQTFGLEVNKNALMLGLTYLDQVSSPNGHHGYTKAGEGSSRMPGDHATRYPLDKGEALTAAGLFCRYFLGQNPKTQPVMKAAADRLLKKLPKWDPKAGSIDHYYWYYGTFAMFQVGGHPWRSWNRSMLKALLPNQDRDGNLAGSWAPHGVWGEQGGRVYSTALSVLTLEASYRYTRLVR